jgi:hypothetical protein
METPFMEGAQSALCRRFNTIDGMILVAALGLWLSVMPGYFVTLPWAFREMCALILQLSGIAEWSRPATPLGPWRELHIAVHNVLAPWPFLFGYVLPAVLVLGLRQPRPSWRALVLRSGFGSCLLVVLYALVRLEVWWLAGDRFPFYADAAFAIFLLWVVLGRPPWRADPTWLDRLGRGIGLYWVVFFAIRAADHFWLGCGG